MPTELINAPRFLRWLDTKANAETHLLTGSLPEEIESKFWPITKITTYRMLAIPSGVALTAANLAILILTGFIYVPYLGVRTVTCFFRIFECRRLENWTSSISSTTKESFIITVRNISELFHGLRALFYGYSSSSVFTPEEIKQMLDGQRIQEIQKLKAPDFIMNNGREFPFHKELIEHTRAQPFIKFISSAFKEANQPKSQWDSVPLSDAAMIALRRFVYFGRTPLDMSLAQELLIFARRWGYESLEQQCINKMQEEINEYTIAAMMALADKEDLTSLQHACFTYILNHNHFIDLIRISTTLMSRYHAFLEASDIPSTASFIRSKNFADVEIMGTGPITLGKQTNPWKLYGHIILFKLHCPSLVEMCSKKSEKENSYILNTFSEFSQQAVDDFLNYVYFKELPEVVIKDNSIDLSPLANCLAVIRHVNDDMVNRGITHILEDHLTNVLKDLMRQHTDKILDTKIFNSHIESIQELADLQTLPKIVNLCVKMRLNLLDNLQKDYPKLIQPTRNITELDLTDFEERYPGSDPIKAILKWVIEKPKETPFLETILVYTTDRVDLKILFENAPRVKTIVIHGTPYHSRS